MSRIVISLRAYSDAQRFTEYLREYFYKFYSNTGIENESSIQNAYETDTKRLLNEIIDEVVRCLEIWHRGVIQLESESVIETSLTYFIRHFSVTAQCTYHKNDNFYTVKQLEFKKK